MLEAFRRLPRSDATDSNPMIPSLLSMGIRDGQAENSARDEQASEIHIEDVGVFDGYLTFNNIEEILEYS